MRMPQKKMPGDPVLATDWNLLLDAIAARTPCHGNGLEFIASSGGFSYSLPPPKGETPTPPPPFSVIAIAKSGSNYLVTIREGWVIERRPKTGDHPAVKFHMPEYDGKALDAIPKPEIGMSIGDILWCEFKTDETGTVTGKPEIIVAADDKDGVHYYPRDPESSGNNGDYYVKLFKLEIDEQFPRVKVYQQSDIEHWAQLWTGENIGGAPGEVFKEHKESENIYKFRTVDGRGDYTDDSPDAGVTEQIKVVKDDDVVRVLGNGKKGSRVWMDCDGNEVMRIEWNDGLITSSGDEYMEAGCDGVSSYSYYW